MHPPSRLVAVSESNNHQTTATCRRRSSPPQWLTLSPFIPHPPPPSQGSLFPWGDKSSPARAKPPGSGGGGPTNDVVRVVNGTRHVRLGGGRALHCGPCTPQLEMLSSRSSYCTQLLMCYHAS